MDDRTVDFLFVSLLLLKHEWILEFKACYHQNLSSIKASEELNNILSKKRSPLNKTGIGYEEGTSSSQ